MATTTERMRDALLLEPGTRVTCPKCEHEFTLEEGFAKKSLETIEAASDAALADVRAGIAASVQARLEREADERELRSKGEIESLRKLIQERDDQHAASLREMRELEKRNAAAQLEQMKQMLEERDTRLKGFLAQEQV